MNLNRFRPDRSLLALLQGMYYSTTGLWPVIHLASFEWFTGRKHDGWLVKCVGAMLGVDGLTLIAARRRPTISDEMAFLAGGTAVVLATVDIYYYRRGILRFVYLLDAVAEIVLALGWLASGSNQEQGTHPAPSSTT